ncbi:MAG: RNA methyltransferase substrate-binding domain-containing protein, partial [bacterium]
MLTATLDLRMLLPRAKEKELRALNSPHGRKKADVILVEGARAIGTLLDNGKLPEFLVISPEHFSATGGRFFERLKSLRLQTYESPAIDFAKLADTENSQGFLAVVKRTQFSADSEAALQQARL